MSPEEIMRFGGAAGCFAGALGLGYAWWAGHRRMAAAARWPRASVTVSAQEVVFIDSEGPSHNLILHLDTPSGPRQVAAASAATPEELAADRERLAVGTTLEMLLPPGSHLAYFGVPNEGGGHFVPGVMALGFLAAGVAFLAGWIGLGG